LLPPELLPPELLPPELLPPELLPPELLPPDALPLPDEPCPLSSLVPDVPQAIAPTSNAEIRAAKTIRWITWSLLRDGTEQVACPPPNAREHDRFSAPFADVLAQHGTNPDPPCRVRRSF
jgi:hypothetical protein